MRQTRIVRNITLGIENLLLHKLRSFLTMLGVVFGVGSVVAMLSVGEGASQEALAQIRKLGSNNIIISSIKSAEEEAMSTQHSHMSIYGLTYLDHERIAVSFANVRQTAPAKLMRKESRLGERAMELRVVGATPAWFDLVPRALVAGRALVQSDQDRRAPVAVLTEFGARKILDHERIAVSFANVRQTAPVKLMRKESRLGERAMELRVVGATPAWFDLVPRALVAGRALVQSDQDRRAPVAVLTEFGARKILATESTIGETLRIGSDAFEVVGIIKSESGQAGNIQIPDQEIDVYIPLEVARRYFGDITTKVTSGSHEREKVELHQIIVQVDDPRHAEAVAAGIERMLGRFHSKKDYILSVPLALLKQAEATKRTFNIVLGSIAGISLLVGGIGIMNIMLASVTERTREIGIRRAIGAKRRQIIVQFLIETVVLSMIGGMIGLGLGVLIPLLITHFSGMATVVTLNGILLPLFISMAIGILFGLYPAMNAAKVDPIVALRHE